LVRSEYKKVGTLKCSDSLAANTHGWNAREIGWAVLPASPAVTAAGDVATISVELNYRGRAGKGRTK
jgi:hypothetical protein